MLPLAPQAAAVVELVAALIAASWEAATRRLQLRQRRQAVLDALAPQQGGTATEGQGQGQGNAAQGGAAQGAAAEQDGSSDKGAADGVAEAGGGSEPASQPDALAGVVSQGDVGIICTYRRQVRGAGCAGLGAAVTCARGAGARRTDGSRVTHPSSYS
jgi:hypothetical protein